MGLRDIWANFRVPEHGGALRRTSEQERADGAVKRSRRPRSSGGSTLAREVNSPDAWTRVPAAMGGVALIARICASVPVTLVRKHSDGHVEPVEPSSRDDGEFARLLMRPNRHQSPYQFYNTLFNQLAAYGNVYIWIKPGVPKELWILNGRSIDVRLTAAWHKEYRYRSYEAAQQDWRSGIPTNTSGSLLDPFGGTLLHGDSPGRTFVGQDGVLSLPLPGRPRGDAILNESEVIHVTGQTLTTLQGVNPAAQFGRTFGLHSSVELMASEFAASGGRKPLLVAAKDPNTPPDKLDDAREELENRKDYESAVFVAGGEFSVQEFGTGMDKMDEARMASLHDVWRVYGVPPTYGGKEDADSSSKSVEEMTRIFIQTTIAPLQRAVGDALRDGLSPMWHTKSAPVEVHFDNSRLTKASLVARTQHYKEMLAGGVVSPNEVRTEEGKQPREGGDEYLDPMEMNARMGAPNTDGSERSDTERSRRQRSDGESEGPRE